jgi:dimethylamine/trimethylamine dehydrogenase
VHRALAKAGVELVTMSRISGFVDGEAVIANLFTGVERRVPCQSLVIVGLRRADDSLHRELVSRPADLEAAGILSVERIGDALAPGAIVHAVYSGHRYARELDSIAVAHVRDAPLASNLPAPRPEIPREHIA